MSLKKYVRENCGKDAYKVVFRHIDKVNNYAAYIGMDKQKGYSKCSKEEFYSFLKKEIKITDEDILRDMDNGDFLPKQVSNANGVIPYQLNLQELDAILENAKKSFRMTHCFVRSAELDYRKKNFKQMVRRKRSGGYLKGLLRWRVLSHCFVSAV